MNLIKESVVKNHYISKQRVKEEIYKRTLKPRAECQSCRHQDENRKVREAMKELLKELGLE